MLSFLHFFLYLSAPSDTHFKSIALFLPSLFLSVILTQISHRQGTLSFFSLTLENIKFSFHLFRLFSMQTMISFSSDITMFSVLNTGHLVCHHSNPRYLIHLKIATVNTNGFNKASTYLARFITQHNIYFFLTQETYTFQKQQLSHLCHIHNLLVYPNSKYFSSPQITHRQGTLILIHTQQKHLTPQMIISHEILLNYIQTISFTHHNVNFTLINCYLPSGNTSSQTIKRVKAIQSIISFSNNLDFRNRQLIIVSDFNLILNSINRTVYFAPNTNDKILFQKLISNFDLTDSYRYFYPYTKIFSFLRSRPISRLDRIYISSSLIPKISNTSYYSYISI